MLVFGNTCLCLETHVCVVVDPKLEALTSSLCCSIAKLCLQVWDHTFCHLCLDIIHQVFFPLATNLSTDSSLYLVYIDSQTCSSDYLHKEATSH